MEQVPASDFSVIFKIIAAIYKKLISINFNEKRWQKSCQTLTM